jgi:Ser/Thr protein kinase RdoA (MazF antagonist)
MSLTEPVSRNVLAPRRGGSAPAHTAAGIHSRRNRGLTLDAMVMTSDLEAMLRKRWQISGVDVRALTGGMNSRSWHVRRGADSWVAKWVKPARRPSLLAGLLAAATVEQAGLRAGAGVPTSDGNMVLETGDGSLALLSWVEGSPLDGAKAEQTVLGDTLGWAHAALSGFRQPNLPRFHWVDPGAAHLDVEAWVRPLVRAAVEEVDALDPDTLTWGLLHGDPAPEAFLWSHKERRCALIDWSSAIYGPLLYDVASAVMYVGGLPEADELVSAYLARNLLSDHELGTGLQPMRRFREAVQADYFARRIVERDLTGLTDMSGNLKGLHDAQRRRGLL